MNDPTEILDTLAARAAADPVAAVPPRRALEAELRNRRRRHRIARVGVGVVVLLIGGVSWSALRDADNGGVTVVAAEETPAPDAGDSDAPQPAPSEQGRPAEEQPAAGAVAPAAGPAVTTADALRNLPALAPLGRAAEMLDITPGWPAADAFYADANPGNVAVRGRFVAAEQQIREWVAVRFVVTENLAGDPDAARPGDELIVMVFTGGQVEPARVGEQLALIDEAVLFLYRDPALYPELPDAFAIEDNVFLGVVDDEGLVHFPFAERAGWPSDPLPIDTIG